MKDLKELLDEPTAKVVQVSLDELLLEITSSTFASHSPERIHSLVNDLLVGLSNAITLLALQGVSAGKPEAVPPLVNNILDELKTDIKKRVKVLCEEVEELSPFDPNAELREELLRSKGQ